MGFNRPTEDLKPIRTLYRGTWYRSRLEAHWAAFFDLCGWRVAYEPVDLRYWIPDFVVSGKSQQFLVEVKPYTDLREFDVHQAKFDEGVRDTHWESWPTLQLGGRLFCDGNDRAIIGRVYLKAHTNGLDEHYALRDVWLTYYDSWIGLWCSGGSADLMTDSKARFHLPYKVAQGFWAKAGNEARWHAAEAEEGDE